MDSCKNVIFFLSLLKLAIWWNGTRLAALLWKENRGKHPLSCKNNRLVFLQDRSWINQTQMTLSAWKTKHRAEE